MPATVDRLGVHPHHVGALPPQCAALNRHFLNVVELVVAAAVEGDPGLIRHAAMVDPNTAAALTVDADLGAVRRHGRRARRPLPASLRRTPVAAEGAKSRRLLTVD